MIFVLNYRSEMMPFLWDNLPLSPRVVTYVQPIQVCTKIMPLRYIS